jgi:hypothetical protein
MTASQLRPCLDAQKEAKFFVSPWLDKICQITMKSATGIFPQKFSQLNGA